jgi:hypothetical protein
VIIPMAIIGALDIQMFMLVRNSTRRIQPQHINEGVGGINNHQVKITRRDISLLKHMIFTFRVFIVGWTPVLLLSLIVSITPGHIFQIICCMYLSIFCSFSIVIYLFICNHYLRMFLFNPIRRCFEH